MQTRNLDTPTDAPADPNLTTSDGPGPAAVTPPPAAGDRYRLGEEIARGGMGAVYRATDTTFGREVAVKVLLDKYALTSGTARRFNDEARITGQLQHPGIPPVFDLGTLADGRPFLAMKLIKGETLDDLLKGNPDRGRLVAAFEQVCQAVGYAHAHGVVHRDLKPQNVMVGSFGEVQVMDWGLAKVLADARPAAADDPESTAAGTAIRPLRDSEDLLTQAGSVLGTPAYMAPEQALGAVHEIDARTDVFGLGGILAAVLTGRPPFVGDTAETTRVMAARGELGGCFGRLDACGADPELVALCKRCLSPNKDDRPADARQVAAAVAALRQAADDRARQAELDRVKAEGEVAAVAAASAERRKRRRVIQWATAVLTLAVVGGLGAVLLVQRQANADLAAKNTELAAEQAKVERRFDIARKAIAAFHSTIDAQPELGNEAFRPLRKKLLGSAVGFYRELEALLAGEADPKSRSALADDLEQLGELTAKLGDPTQALSAYRRALAIRRELAAFPGADLKSRLAVVDIVQRVGGLMASTGDRAGEQQAIEELQLHATVLAAEPPTADVRHALARIHLGNGLHRMRMGKPADGLASVQTAQDLFQKLADSHPAVTEYQRSLASSHLYVGILLMVTGRPADGLVSYETARDIYQKLADANPALIDIL